MHCITVRTVLEAPTCMCLRLNIAPIAAQEFHQIDAKSRMFTTTSAVEYTALELESGSATPALIISARKLEKKITKHP